MAKSSIQLGLLVSVVLVSGTVLAADADKDKRTLERALLWAKAAQSHESAAIIQQVQAESLLKRAQELRKKGYLYDRERRKNFNKTGDAEKKAGDLEGAAYGTLGKVATLWERAAKEYKKLHEDEKWQDATIMAQVARQNALLACERAVSAYELAAEAFSVDNANQPAKESAAWVKAAAWIEKLAGRK